MGNVSEFIPPLCIMKLKTFAPLRPPVDLSPIVASPPYDVIDSEEARRLAHDNPKSFLHVIKPEIDLPGDVNLYDERVYAKAAENFAMFRQNGWLRREAAPGLYLYRQSYEGHSQTGVVAVCHTEDYAQDVIRKHERTLQKKEDDRTRHVATLKANAGPVFLMVRGTASLHALLEKEQTQEPEVDFHSPDQVRHTVWKVVEPEPLLAWFHAIPAAYVADGHHRSASAARCSKEFASANPAHTGEEDYNWFLSVLFPAEDLQVLPYNRLVKGLNGLTPDALLAAAKSAGYAVGPAADGVAAARGEVRMYLGGEWYKLLQPNPVDDDPVSALDVSILQNALLAPVLGISDPRTDARISFLGGFDCLERMAHAVDQERADVAFSLYPTSTAEIMSVADAGLIMPPKSTWFEPKLRSGLFVHTL